MIDIRDLKAKINKSDKYRGSDLDNILREYPDQISEEQYLTLVPIILKLGKPPEALA